MLRLGSNWDSSSCGCVFDSSQAVLNQELQGNKDGQFSFSQHIQKKFFLLSQHE